MSAIREQRCGIQECCWALQFPLFFFARSVSLDIDKQEQETKER